MFFKRFSLLFSVLLLTIVSCVAQNTGPTVPTGVPQLFGGKYYQFSGYVRVDSALMLSARDTFVRPIRPSVIYRSLDSTLYFWNMTKWAKIGAGVSVESDPTVGAHIKALTTADTANFRTAYRKRPVSLVFDSLGKKLNLTLGDGTILSDTIKIVGSDNWGTQFVRTDQSLVGRGILDSLLKVDTFTIASRARLKKVVDSLTSIRDTLNFYKLGDSIYVQWNDGNGWETLSVKDSVGSSSEYFDEGASVGTFSKINFVGSGVTTSVVGDRLDVNIAGGGGGGADGNNYPTGVSLNTSGLFTLNRFGLSDLTETFSTSKIPEGTNQYFTTSRARISVSSLPPILYNSTTGIFSADTSLASQALTTYGRLRKVADSIAALIPSVVNIYNSNGTLTGPRTITAGSTSNTLSLSGADMFINGYRIGRGKEDYNNNTIFGQNTGGLFTVNSGGNTVMGRDAGRYITDGYYNTYMGWLAGGRFGQTGYQNAGYGGQALWSVTSGRDNNAMGFQSMYSLTTGIRNQAQGSLTYGLMTTGSDNVGIGILSGFGVVSGSRNTFLGNFAGYDDFYSNRASSDNIFIGYYAGYNDTSSNKLIIENSASPTGLIVGDFNVDSLRFNSSISIRDMIEDGAATKLMVWDSASGRVKWRNVSGIGGGGGGGATIYSGDGTISSALRTVNVNNNELHFSNPRSFIIGNPPTNTYTESYEDAMGTLLGGGNNGKSWYKILTTPTNIDDNYGIEVRSSRYAGVIGGSGFGIDRDGFTQESVFGEDALGRTAGSSFSMRVRSRGLDSTIFQGISDWSSYFGDNGTGIYMTNDSSLARMYFQSSTATGSLSIDMPTVPASFDSRVLPISVNGVYANAAGNINLGNGPVYNFIYNVDNVDVTVSSWDATIIIRNHTTTRTVTLPTAASSVGRVLEIVNAGTGNITTSIAMRKNDSVTVSTIPADTTYRIQSDGSSWFILGVMSR